MATRTETGAAFPFRRGSQNFPEISTGAQVIVDRVKSLLLTGAGEMPFGEDIGTNIHGSVFESITPVSVAIITATIKRVIEANEPRMQVLSVTPSQDERRSTIIIQIQWRVDNTEGDLEVQI
tara:strand:- start:287 stop:652 length:366 start_codon:yes stop_codon:yes gene_type:complete